MNSAEQKPSASSDEGREEGGRSRPTLHTDTEHVTALASPSSGSSLSIVATKQLTPDDDLVHTKSAGTTLSRTPTASAPPSFSHVHEFLFVTVIVFAQLLTQACLAISIAPVHIIGASFGTPSAGQLSWLPAAFSLTVGTFILPAGRYGDLFGHKLLFVIGYIWLAVWSLIAGFAVYSHSLPFFAFCRAMQGIGPAILLPNGIAVLARTYPPGKRKDMVLAIFGATAPGGFALGAVFSGIFAQLVWWPWSYWVLGMVVGLVCVATIAVVPAMPVAGGKWANLWTELDVTGTIMGVGGLVLFNFAWNQGAAAGWQNVYVYVLLIVGVIFILIFLWWEICRAEFPLLPVVAFTRDTNLVFGCVAAGWASFGIWIYYFYQFLQVLEGDSVLLTAAKALPAMFSGAVAAIVTGIVISRVQPGWIMLVSMCSFCVGQILLATNDVGESYWAQFFVSAIIVTWGMDLSFPSSVIVLSNHMPPEQQGVAASLVNTVINYSISIGLGIAGTVESQVNKGGRDVLAGYRGAWYVGIGLDVLGIVLAICLVLSWRATMKQKARVQESEKGVV